MNKKIIFSTGGTGGHIFPAINLMNHFSGRGYDVLLVTDDRGDRFVKKKMKLKSYILQTETTTNKIFFKKILSLLVIVNSIIKSIFILKNEKPNLIFGFGGYVSFPLSFASKFFGIPLIIYENNMVLGRANKYLLPFSKKIFVAKKIIKNFPKKYENKVHEVGSVLAKDIIDFSFNIKKDKKNFSILVLGRSQGAEIFGEIVPATINKIKKSGYEVQIMQQCTAKQKIQLEDFYQKNKIKNYLFEFEENILRLISSADLAITRCGASTTAELAHVFTPFIAVPLPDSIDHHQYLNAKYYEEQGCCWLLNQHSFNHENLFNLIMEAVINKNKLEDMRANMKKIHNKNVYKYIEAAIKDLI